MIDQVWHGYVVDMLDISPLFGASFQPGGLLRGGGAVFGRSVLPVVLR